MSMFRSPLDDSSSDSESGSEEQGEEAPPLRRFATVSATEDVTAGEAESQPERQETASESLQDHEQLGDQENWLPNTVEQHHTLLTSSLLEFVYNVKAAEHLNYAQGGTKFHRESPEARALGTKMFQGASEVLVSNGILPECVHEDDWTDTRRQYLIGIDNLGLQAFNESMSKQAPPPRGRPSRPEAGALVRRTSRPRQDFHNLVHSAYLTSHIAESNKHRELMADMMRRLAVPSPLSEMQLSLSRSAVTGNRYRADFRELKQLGRGGFGTVYHVKNFVDNQDYAVKKIPLDTGRMKMLRDGGARELEGLLKEIRTLARLEHSNIVRYFGAWIEYADTPGPPTKADFRPHQLLLKKPELRSGASSSGNRPHRRPAASQSHEEIPTGFVFEEDTRHDSAQQSWERHDNMGIVFGEDSVSKSENQESNGNIPSGRKSPAYLIPVQHSFTHLSNPAISSSNESDIFTDGDGQVQSRNVYNRNQPHTPLIVLHIQMSLHPITLSSYLTPARSTSPPTIHQSYHCFHLLPSLRLLLAILSGVEHLHANGIIHRDIKPGNIFLSEHRKSPLSPGCIELKCPDCQPNPHMEPKRFLNPRIGDFGLVADIRALTDAASPHHGSPSPRKAVGTEFYRPPPISARNGAGGQDIDEKLDIFALGVLLFELLWKMDTKMERHVTLGRLSNDCVLPTNFQHKIDPCGKPCPIRSDAKDRGAPVTVGKAVEDCVKNMVCPDSAKRWGCKEVRERVEGVVRVLDGPP
jgi:eukaryotic translation initiation factor 2-alpha kinase 3